jgi:hypothetical protein
MAANGVMRVNDRWRQKIKVGLLIDRLQKHVHGEVELSTTQIAAAKILLSKVAPDLQQTSAEHVHRHTIAVRHIEIAPVSVTHQPAPAILEADYTLVAAEVPTNNIEGGG